MVWFGLVFSFFFFTQNVKATYELDVQQEKKLFFQLLFRIVSYVQY
jgi:hypothetical protein